MLAAWMHVFEVAGATPREAACLAPGITRYALALSGPPQPSDQEIRRQVRCVGSVVRQQAITRNVFDWLWDHFNEIATSN